tara:strand:- start:253 stop:414 length:162 start_codon:yes stop_codon:yes gene_type:complete
LSYGEEVKFIDPTLERNGIDEYIKTKDRLINRCDDIFLESLSLAIKKNIGFVE